MDAAARLERLFNFTIVRRRFVHEILMMMTKIVDPKIDTMGVRVVGTGFELRYNPTFFNGLTDPEAMYVITHEIYHLALHHCTRTKFDDHQLGNIAQDLAVNELIEEDKSCQRPRTLDNELYGTFVEEYEKDKRFKGIQRKQSAEWYYHFLSKRIPSVKLVIRGCGKGDGKNKGQNQGKDGKDKKDKKGEITIEVFDNHDGWDKNNEIADAIMKEAVERISRNNLWGDMSTDVVEIIKAAQKAKVNWRRFVRRWSGNLVWKDREQTIKKPNRRTGFLHPGFKKVTVNRILAAFDTSGSVGSEELAQFVTEVNRIHEIMPVDVCQFDADITEEPKPFTRKRASYDIKGRGGTNFQPVIDLATKRGYRGLIILTDGAAPAPTQPMRTRVLWALTEKGCTAPVDWGERVWIEK